MRTVFATAMMAVASASKVHDFFAEQNFICGICQQAVEYAKKGDNQMLSSLYELFPALEHKVSAFNGNEDLIDLSNPSATCENLNLCARENVADLLLAEVPVNFDAIVEHVNKNPKSSWKATKNAKFDGASQKEIKKIMGTVVDPEWTIKAHTKTFAPSNVTLPTNFDARVQWPECAGVIGFVRDQSDCGSCWAHGTTEALNDRKCIASGGAFQTKLSVADTTACCNGTQCMSFGCNGGQVATPWAWFKRTGVVSGGGFGENEFCFDYTMPKCAHHVTVEGMASCDDVPTNSPVCSSTCQSNKAIDYKNDHHFASSSYGINGVENIK